MQYIEELDDIVRRLNERKIGLEKEYENLPEGVLYVESKGDKEYYRCRLPKKGNRKKERRTSLEEDPATLNALIRKKYISKTLKIIDKDVALLEKTATKYVPLNEESVMADFIEEYPALKDGIYRNSAADKEWMENYERQKDFYDEDLTSVASDGTSRRSRGETLIGEKLREYGIPYRYEAGIGIPEVPYVPDYTIKRPRDGKIFYWEHIGDVNDEEYMKRNARKFEVYERYGIVPWDNLIVTYDFANGGINVPLIVAMIHAWLI